MQRRFGGVARGADPVEQPRVLHGNHRLCGEILQQRDLLVGERPHLLTVDHNGADQRVFLTERHGDPGSRPAEIDNGVVQRAACAIGVRRREVYGVHELPAARDVHERGRISDFYRSARKLGKSRWRSEKGGGMKGRSIITPKDATNGLAEPDRLFEHDVEDRGEVAWRAIDDL